jgi:hypothetical protein
MLAELRRELECVVDLIDLVSQEHQLGDNSGMESVSVGRPRRLSAYEACPMLQALC